MEKRGYNTQDQELLPIYEDMLHGNCCCMCLEPFFEADGRTPTSKLFPDLCLECAITLPIELRRKFYQTNNDTIGNSSEDFIDSIRRPKRNNKKPALVDVAPSAFYGQERLQIQKLQIKQGAHRPKDTPAVARIKKRIADTVIMPDWPNVLSNSDFKIESILNCFYCNEAYINAGVKRTVEHIVPKSNGGRRVNFNKVFACSKCNNSKGNMNIFQFRKMIESRSPIDLLGISKRARMLKNIDRLIEDMGRNGIHAPEKINFAFSGKVIFA